MERLNDIKTFINHVNHDEDVTYTKEMREDALCVISGVKWANEMYVYQLTQFVFDMTCGDPKDALAALQRKEQLVKDIERAFEKAGISRHLDPDKLVKGIHKKSLQLENRNGMFRDIYNKLIAMPEEGTYQCSRDRVAAKPKTKYDGKQLGSAYKITIREPGE